MRHIDRGCKPDILAENEERWLKEYEAAKEANPKARPLTSRYRHRSILEALKAVSHTKCFYCEKSLKGAANEIDHFIEVAIDMEGAYRWDNLVLSCDNCNNKADHSRIPVTDVLNPCCDSDEKIRQHITFANEQIVPKDGSELGMRTITKYRLDSERLDYQRMSRLNVLSKIYIDILRQMNREHREILTDAERCQLAAFTSPNSEFSYLCQRYLEKLGLL